MKYQTHKGDRTKYGFLGIYTNEKGYCYHNKFKRWIDHRNPDYNWEGDYYSYYQPCNSMKAFRRKLKKCPKDVEFTLVSRWIGYDIIGKNTKKQ